MRSRGSITLFHFCRVPVRLHASWALAAVYLTFLFGMQFAMLTAAAHVHDVDVALPPWLWGPLMTIALFACVLVHEMAHVAAAQRRGSRVRSITLMMLGGASEIAVPRPEVERWMSLAGPAASLAIALVLEILFRLGHGWSPDVRFSLFCLSRINLAVGAFNLLPAFPMDGGRVLRSLLAARWGVTRATHVAATIGKLLAIALVLRGALGGSLWLGLIGLFLFVTGEAEDRAVVMREAVRHCRVADVMNVHVPVVVSQSTVGDVAWSMQRACSDIAVVAVADRPLGFVTVEMLKRAKATAGESVLSHIARLPEIPVDAQVPAALAKMDDEHVDLLAVINSLGLMGTVSRADIERYAELQRWAERVSRIGPAKPEARAAA